MQLIGPSYNLESRPASVQRTVNMVPVPLEPGNERAPWVFKDVPGFEKAVSLWATGQTVTVAEQEVTVGVAASVDVTGAWPSEAGPFSWSVIGGGALPAGISLNESTGILTGTCTADPLLFPVRLRRFNISEETFIDSTTFNIAVARIVELVAPGNCGPTSAVGVAISGFSSTLTYRASLLATPRPAWSGFGSDASNGGLTWSCVFFINSTGYNPHSPISYYATAALAYAASASFSATVTGSTTYTFWMFDPNPSDDRGGLTIKIRPDT